jgi:hypothetical protein
MPDSIPLSDLQGGKAAAWNVIGDRYQGRIVAMEQRQQTNTEGQPLSWNDGSPRMQWVISIEQANGDVVNLYAKGGAFTPVQGDGKAMLVAIGEAVKAANGQGLRLGDELVVAFTGLGEAKGGKNAPKLFTAAYRAGQPPAAAPSFSPTPAAPVAPVMATSMPVADLFSDQG